MADETASTSAPAESTTPKKSQKKTAVTKAKVAPRPKASHPTTAVMVNNAIQHLKERGGSSLQAIKKYMASTYKVDADKLAPFIKKYIKASVASGALVQTKGKGASGSFKLAQTGPKPKVAKSPTSPTIKVKKTVAKKPAAKKAVATKKTKTPEKAAASPSPKKAASPAKKVAKPKKSPAKKKPAAAAAPAAAVVAKPTSPAKAKKTVKSPAKKAKSPKAKPTKPKAAAAKAKKAAPKKK